MPEAVVLLCIQEIRFSAIYTKHAPRLCQGCSPSMPRMLPVYVKVVPPRPCNGY
eukprot:gene12354-biopygen5069